MPSDTEIANLALDKLGTTPLGSLDDETVTGELVKRVFPQIRDRVLRSHIWNFALKRTSLAASTATPTFEYTYSYTMPTDPNFCLRLVEVDGEEDIGHGRWKIEGRQILTDIAAPLKIRYVSRVTDYGNWDPLAVDAFAALLASELAPALGESDGAQSNLVQLYREKISEARSVDGQEGMPDQMESCEWIDARY